MKNMIDWINSGIDDKIAVHEKQLTMVEDGKIRQFINGCIAGLRNAKLSIPLRETVDQQSNDANRVLAIRAVVETHTEKLNIMKDNLSRWEEERWTDAEVRECESMIRTLASILSDLNRSLV